MTAATYGTTTAIPAITINAQGQITSATTNSISTTLAVAVDNAGAAGDSSGTIALGSDTLTFVGDSAQGIEVSFNNEDKKLTISKRRCNSN